MKRLLTFFFAGVAMFVVAVLTAFTSMRLAIHGREVDVPNLAGLSDAGAAEAARKLGLNLSVENRFYSAGVQPNHVLSQSPAAGLLVRRGGQVRVTESLGGQNVSIPDVTGETERPAGLMLRRLQLDLGTTAHLPAPAPPGTVLTQTPPANTAGVFGPRVSILVADPPSNAPAQSYIMPSLVGMTLAAASARLSSAGLRISNAQDPSYIPPPSDPNPVADPNGDPAIPPDVPPPPPLSQNSPITGQSPLPGHRVSKGDPIRVTVAHPAPATTPSVPPLE